MKTFAQRYPKVADTTAVSVAGGLFGAFMVFLYNLPI